MHLVSVSASHRGAADKLARFVEASGRLRHTRKPPMGAVFTVAAASTLHPNASAAETSTHHGAAASLLDLPEHHGGSALHPTAQVEETSTHLVSAAASHRGAAASLLDLSALQGGSVANANHLQQVHWCRGKHSQPACFGGRDEHEHAPSLCPPPPRTVEQPQACSICRSFGGSVANANHL